ncbi:hypothetical protein [Kitasatospora phosalacinea]|uniref:Uncharacterized protein n=1 Tax=Kitasatospora phosalacinea TaxID=2065 RepID=A0ABW6GM05_9ACTN
MTNPEQVGEGAAATGGLGADRREFLRRAALGTVAAVPVVASFQLSGSAAAASQTPNLSGPVRPAPGSDAPEGAEPTDGPASPSPSGSASPSSSPSASPSSPAPTQTVTTSPSASASASASATATTTTTITATATG